MTSQEAIYKRNLESSILFMQQEHASTLKALHEEIQKLQKKCSDLTFQLNMQDLDLNEQVDPATQEHMKHLEAMIDNQRETQHELEIELDKKDKLIRENDYNYKRQKMKYLEDLRSKNKDIEHLKAKLETYSNQNAFLTNELLQVKKQQNSKAGHVPTDVNFAPVPPRESRTHPKRSMHVRRGLDQNLDEVRKSSASTSRSESPAEMVKPFLRHETEVDAEIHVKQQPPLPPIRSSSGRLMVHPDQVDLVHVSMHTVTKPVSKFKKPSKAGATQEIQTLAVGKLPHTDSAWVKRPHESQSSDFH